MELLVHAPNAKPINHFFNGLFRPMSFIYYLPQIYFFGTQAYGFYLTTIFFHSLNAILLFNISNSIVSTPIAFCGGLYFAFHPSLFDWLGWISAQTYFIELFVLLILLLFLKKFLDTNQIKYYLISCFLYLTNLYLKEATIIFPFWIILAIYFYNNLKKPFLSFLQKIKKSFKVSIGYWLVAIFYLITRGLVFSFNMDADTPTNFNFKLSFASFIARQKERFPDLVTYILEFFGLRWIPPHHPIIKGIPIIIATAILFCFFSKNNKKRYIIFLLFSTLIFSWPSLLIHYHPRYIYLGIPFFITAIAITLNFIKQENFSKKLKLIGFITFSLLILLNIAVLTHHLKKKEKWTGFLNQSFHELAQKPLIKESIREKKDFCFYNLPHSIFPGKITSALWLFTGSSDYKIYQFDSKPKGNTINNLDYKNLTYITWDYENSKFLVLNQS